MTPVLITLITFERPAVYKYVERRSETTVCNKNRTRMYLVFVSLFAVAAAAPQYLQQSIHHGPNFYPDVGLYLNQDIQRASDPGRYGSFISDDIFDTKSFWDQFSTQMRELNDALDDMHRRLPAIQTNEGVDGNEYKITIPLQGFEEKEIVVRARPGTLMVKAEHKEDDRILNSYLNLRGLPDCVETTGSWTYEKGVLKITFPLKQEAVDQNKVETEAPTFETATESREEVGDQNSNIEDADVGLKRAEEAQSEQEHMLLTNEVPNNAVEATTYAVDVKGDIEFVPVQ